MIHFVVGTRAQLLKMAPVMRECERRHLQWRWIYTAQHHETIASTIETFALPQPDVTVIDWEYEASSRRKMLYWLTRVVMALGRGRRLLGDQVGPDHVVLTHGDTITTWWGAVLGRLNRCRVMHVEAGLRSFNLREPFPEEINRLITFRLANYFACPGPWASTNVARYGRPIVDTGLNTQYDALQLALSTEGATRVTVPPQPYVVASIHRYENVYIRERMAMIVGVIEDLADRFTVLFILHPVTATQLVKQGLHERLCRNPAVVLLPRQDYLSFVQMVGGAEFVITDGGGNQEELFYMGKPTLLLRQRTERQEGLGATAVVSGLDRSTIRDFVGRYHEFAQPPVHVERSPSSMIVDFLVERGHGN